MEVKDPLAPIIIDSDDDSVQVNNLPAIDEEVRNQYFTWKKNAPYLYDFMLSSSIPWPSLTVEWFPDVEELSNNNSNFPTKNQRLLLGTRTLDQDDEFLRIAQVTLPDFEAEKNITPDLTKFDSELGEIGGYTNKFNTDVSIIQRITHHKEVNRARYMPQNPNIIATLSSSGTAYIFDRSKHSLNPNKEFQPDIRLNHHKEEGYGLSWNTFDRGLLLTGSEDSTVALWDINHIPTSKLIVPKTVYKFHSQIVNEVEWHPHHNNLFGSASDDSTLRITDLRSPDVAISTATGDFTEAINSLAFNPANEYLLATGSSSNTITLWDTRKMPNSLHTMKAHKQSINSLQWNPHFASILASASQDRKVMIWDVAMIGEQLTDEESKDGPPELLFVHGGHTNGVFDISWNPAVPWMIASVGDDNQLHIWKAASNIVDIE